MIDREKVIQWYPGHMAAAMREIERRSSLIDIFIEVIDSRIIHNGANAELSQILRLPSPGWNGTAPIGAVPLRSTPETRIATRRQRSFSRRCSEHRAPAASRERWS